MKHIARKRFGQHFLSDGGIIDSIVREIAPQPGDAMVEIGPGLGAITRRDGCRNIPRRPCDPVAP